MRMFKAHRIWSDNLSARNLILLFLTIVLWFASVITLAQISIPSDISNAKQTIQQVTVTDNGTDNGTKYRDINYDGKGTTYINPNALQEHLNFSWRVLWLDDSGNLIFTYSNWLAIQGGGWDTVWSQAADNIYRLIGNISIWSREINGKVYIENRWSPELVLKDTEWMTNIHLISSFNTWTIWTNPNVFYIGIPWQPIFLAINTGWYIGIWTDTPTQALDINWSIRIRELMEGSSKLRYVLMMDADGTIYKIDKDALALSWAVGPQWPAWATGTFVGSEIDPVFNERLNGARRTNREPMINNSLNSWNVVIANSAGNVEWPTTQCVLAIAWEIKFVSGAPSHFRGCDGANRTRRRLDN